jgi:hypothetical protein
VHPDLHPGPRFERVLGLGDLVGVVDRDVVDAASVDVDARSQMLGGHGAALDVPTRKADAPRTLPLQLPAWSVLGRQLPQGKVGRILLAGVVGHAGMGGAGAQARQGAVARVARGVEVDAVVREVGEAFLPQRADHLDLLRNVLGRTRPHVRLAHVQQRKILLEQLGPDARHLQRGGAAGRCRQLELVFSAITVVGQVPDVGDVDDVSHLQAFEAQHAGQ